MGTKDLLIQMLHSAQQENAALRGELHLVMKNNAELSAENLVLNETPGGVNKEELAIILVKHNSLRRKIPSIAEYRRITGAPLKEAKDAIEQAVLTVESALEGEVE